ncbi:B-cell receptor-associated protein 31-like [Cariama cristata]
MSLQWTAVATFLYAEVFLVLLLCVPFVSAARWQKIFKTCLVGLAMAYGIVFVIIIIIIPVLLLFGGCWNHPPGVLGLSCPGPPFADALSLQKTCKYDVLEWVALQSSLSTLKHFHMKPFWAQCNLYLASFALLPYL